MTNTVLLCLWMLLLWRQQSGGVIAIVLSVVSGIEGSALRMGAMILVSLLCSLMFMFLSRKLLVQSEIMN